MSNVFLHLDIQFHYPNLFLVLHIKVQRSFTFGYTISLSKFISVFGYSYKFICQMYLDIQFHYPNLFMILCMKIHMSNVVLHLDIQFHYPNLFR